jgi:hypothetical protein
MKTTIASLSLSTMIALSMKVPVCAAEDPIPVTREQICRTLFDSYLQGTKVNASTINASVELIADTCRRTQFWHVLLEDVRSGGRGSERYSVRILGKMLAVDAAARDLMEARKRGEHLRSPWMPGIALSPEVVDVLLKRASEVDMWMYHHYVIALARARDERARPLLLSILVSINEKDSHPSVKFHAAVGLVGLGDPKGVEWLIDQAENQSALVLNAWPGRVPKNDLSTCCRYALCGIASGALYETRTEWQTWWASRKESFKRSGSLRLVDFQQ